MFSLITMLHSVTQIVDGSLENKNKIKKSALVCHLFFFYWLAEIKVCLWDVVD